MIRPAGLALALIACSGSARPLQITGATPAYGPLVGGTRITIAGTGFTDRSVEVVIGGRAAPLAAVVDDTTVEAVIPPAERPGDAEIVVLDGDRNARASGVFHYSAPPVVTAVAPADVMYSAGAAITVTGSGFLDEGAGDVSVAVDGQLATDVTIVSDTQLTFTAPPGRPLARPEVDVVDLRGTATAPRAFRYIPSTRGGLVLFPTYGSWFAVFFDPVDNSWVPIDAAGPLLTRFTSVMRDERGDYWGMDRARRFGRVDTTTQTLEAPLQTQAWFPTMVRANGVIYGLERNFLRFGTFDPETGAFEARGASLPCCGSYGLAFDGTTLYFAARLNGTVGIGTIDPATGAQSALIPVTAGPGFHVEEMRFFHGTLYATSRDGTLVTIDPATGATTALPVGLGRFNAMEVFE